MIAVREIRAAAFGAAILLGYLLLVLGSGRVDLAQFGALWAFYLQASIAMWVFLALILQVVRIAVGARRSGREPFLRTHLRDLLLARWERDRCVSLVWPPLLLATLLASFNSFKQMILPLAGFRFDPFFAQADRALFGGTDPWRVTHAIFSTPEATLMIDSAYHGWFVPMSLGVIVCAFLSAGSYRVRTQYLLTYLGVWIGIGSIVAFLLPAAGPCYYSHFVAPSASYDALTQKLLDAQVATDSTLAALRNQAKLLAAFGHSQLQLGGGISAMPSVHNALAVLFALGAYQLNRVLGWTFGLYAVLIWIGSIHLGWHYAVDGPVAALMTFGLWRASGRVADWLDQPASLPEGRPALA